MDSRAGERSSLNAAPLLSARYVFGECYFEVSKDRADELLESQKAKVDGEIELLKTELGGINDTLANLKKALYGRFGSNINLEE